MGVGRALFVIAVLQQPAGLCGLPSVAVRLGRPAALRAVRLRCTGGLLCAAPAVQPPPPPRVAANSGQHRPRILLGALVLIYISNQWSRALPASLVKFGGVGTGREFMNVALNMDAVQYGWLSSYAFTALYAVTSLAAGMVCDRFSRGAVLLVAAAGWTVATVLQAFATNYPQLVSSRAALGIAQAFCSPAAYPMIGQAFSSESRGMANAIYSSGFYVGYAFASLSAILSRSFGWRLTSLVVAAFSAASTLLLGLVLYLRSPSSAAPAAAASSSSPSAGTTPLLVVTAATKSARAPPSGSSRPPAISTSGRAPPAGPPPAAAPAAPAAGAPVRTVFGTRSAALLLAASTTRSFGGYAVGAWSLPFFRLYHPERAANFAVANGLFIAVGASLSTVLGGWLSDRLVSRGGEGAPADGSTAHRALFVPMCGSLLAIPLWVCVLQTSAFVPAMAALLLSYLVAECWFGALTSTMQGALPQVRSFSPNHPPRIPSLPSGPTPRVQHPSPARHPAARPVLPPASSAQPIADRPLHAHSAPSAPSFSVGVGHCTGTGQRRTVVLQQLAPAHRNTHAAGGPVAYADDSRDPALACGEELARPILPCPDLAPTSSLPIHPPMHARTYATSSVTHPSTHVPPHPPFPRSPLSSSSPRRVRAGTRRSSSWPRTQRLRHGRQRWAVSPGCACPPSSTLRRAGGRSILRATWFWAAGTGDTVRLVACTDPRAQVCPGYMCSCGAVASSGPSRLGSHAGARESPECPITLSRLRVPPLRHGRPLSCHTLSPPSSTHPEPPLLHTGFHFARHHMLRPLPL